MDSLDIGGGDAAKSSELRWKLSSFEVFDMSFCCCYVEATLQLSCIGLLYGQKAGMTPNWDCLLPGMFGGSEKKGGTRQL